MILSRAPRRGAPPTDVALYIFDMGGVVSYDASFERKIAKSLGMPPQRLYALTDAEFQELTAGRISLEEFRRRLSLKIGKPIQEDLFTLHFRPRLNRRVARLVRRLRKEARVVVGTNTVETHYRAHGRAGHYDIFDAVYASCRMGLAKPDPRFYLHILEREGHSPGRTVFVDDRAENAEAAAKLGMTAIRFSGVGRLRRRLAELRGRGFPISG